MVRWYNPPLQTQLKHRAGDVIIAVPGKSGTTWTMNIFHQLKTGGDPDFKDIYAEVPWPELKERPDQTDDELLARWEAMPLGVPRGFKTHSQPGPDGAPAPEMGCFSTFRDDLKYIVVVRNPEEASVSLKPFLEAQNPRLFDLFGVPEMRAQITRPTFEQFFHEVMLEGFPGMPAPPGGMLTMFFFGFINGWWPHRNKPNVLFLHYSEMKRDHEGSIRKIAAHLGFEPTAEQWPKILEYTSFPWMKAHEDKFEIPTLCPFPLIVPGGMVRKGAAGKAAEDGMTPEIAAIIHQWAEKMVPDPAARKWLFEGGAIPPAEASAPAALQAAAAAKKVAAPTPPAVPLREISNGNLDATDDQPRA